jgi:hypothetical protein
VQNINYISKDGSIKGTTRVCGRQRTARSVSSCSPFTPTRERELLTSGSSHLSFGCWKSKQQFLALPQPHTKSRGDWWITKKSLINRDCQSPVTAKVSGVTLFEQADFPLLDLPPSVRKTSGLFKQADLTSYFLIAMGTVWEVWQGIYSNRFPFSYVPWWIRSDRLLP